MRSWTNYNTDLAQSESSLAGAQAQFTQAKSDLLIAKLNL